MRSLSKIITLLVALVLGISASYGQSLDIYKQQLARPVVDSLSGRTATVTAQEDTSSLNILRQVRRHSDKWRFTGWRVCIFSDNTAEARSGARAAINSFEENFSNIPIYDEYASPYFRVSVGNCTTTEEAIILLEKVRRVFPKAFVKQEELTLSELLK